MIAQVKTGISDFLDKVITKFAHAAESQERKGLEKYGQPVNPHDNKWDWLNMAEEELIDAYKYLVAERERRDSILQCSIRELGRLQSNIVYKDPVTVKDIQHIIDTLKKISKNV